MLNSDAGRARPFVPPFNTDNIPGELLALPNWTCWKYDYEKLRDGKPSKPPISIRTGYPVSWSKSENQHAFADVCVAALKHGGGIGFVLKSEDGIIALDLDHVLTDCTLVQWARRLIDMQHDTYWEISPSGNGIRGFVKGRLPADRRISCVPSPGTKLEVFSDKKYVTVTGVRFENAPSIIAQADEAFVGVLMGHLGSERLEPTGGKGGPSVGITPFDLSSPVGILQRSSDDAILERLRIGASGEKFRALYDRGDLNAAKTPGDHSSARITLCNMFMPACMAAARGDTEAALAQAFRLMRESVLFCKPEYAKKWDRLGPRELRNALATREVKAESKRLDRSIAPEHAIWPDIQDLPDIVMSAPTMDASLVPEALRDFCVHEAEQMPVHLETIACPLVIAFTAAVGRRVAIAPKQHGTWKEYATLWGLQIAPPSHKKTPAIGVALQFIRTLENKAYAEFQRHHGDFQARKNEITNEIKELNRLRSGSDAEKAERKDRVKALEKERSKLRLPMARRYVVRDATVEAIGEIIRDNPQGILCHRDELTGWFADLEKSGREGERSFWLSGWSGTEDGSCDRITRGHVHVPRLALSLVGGIQPGPLKEHVRAAHDGGDGADGLLQRFGLPLFPDEKPAFRYVDRPPNAAASARVAALFEALERFDPVAFGAKQSVGEEVPVFRFSAGAQETFIAWYISHEARVDSAEAAAVPAFQAHIAKSPKTLATLSLVFHLIDCIDAKISGPVSADALALAIEWVKFHEHHIAKMYDISNMSPWKKLAWFIREGRVKDGAKLHDLRRNGWSGLNSIEMLEAAVAGLEPYGWCRIEERRAEQGVDRYHGGRFARVLGIHPSLRQGGSSGASCTSQLVTAQSGKSTSETSGTASGIPQINVSADRLGSVPEVSEVHFGDQRVTSYEVPSADGCFSTQEGESDGAHADTGATSASNWKHLNVIEFEAHLARSKTAEVPA